MVVENENIDLLPDRELQKAAECLRVMGHPVRLRIVNLLMQGEFAVGEIAEICGLQPHHASEHLRLLRGRGLLDKERRGREVYYQIAHPRLPALLKCVRRTCSADSQ